MAAISRPPIYTPLRSVLNKRHWRLGPPKAIWNGGLGYCLLGTSEQ